ncbi:MAG: hypothetical protein WCA78_16600 [Rhizomicrobium sp.]
MQPQQPFGRRTPQQRETPPQAAPKLARSEQPRPAQANLAEPAAQHDADADDDRDLAEWKAMRKVRKRSFREPWRSVCIAATIMFGLSTWLLPDSVATIAELVTTGLAIASLFAGFRKR